MRDFKEMQEIDRINKWVKATFETFGLIGCVLMLAVYWQPSLRKLSVSIYFRYIAINCICKTIANLILTQAYFDLMKILKFLPTLLSFFWLLFSPICAWLESLASFDRFMTILFPKRLKLIRTACVQRIMIALVVVLNCLIHLHKLIGYEYIYVIGGLAKNNESSMEKIREFILISGLVSSSALPFMCMLVLSIATLVGVLATRRRLRAAGLANGINALSSRRKLLRDLKFGMTMIFLNLLFIFSIGFHNLRGLISFWNPFDRESQSRAYMLFDILMINLKDYYYMFNFYIQLLVNSIVRKELFMIFSRLVAKIKGLLLNHHN